MSVQAGALLVGIYLFQARSEKDRHEEVKNV